MYVRSDIYTFKKIFKYYEDSKDTKTMNEEPDMMYKLMILYMLDKVNFPLNPLRSKTYTRYSFRFLSRLPTSLQYPVHHL